MATLWSRNMPEGGEVERFTVGDDYLYDQKLIPYDLLGSSAHAKGLEKVGLLSTDEHTNLQKGLSEIKIAYSENQFTISQSDEDCHTAIENFLTKRFGDVGKKIHTGRSRNDQSLTMIRLYEKDRLLDIATEALKLSEKLVLLSAKNKDVIMPGYTHMRQAMPSSFGLWAESFAESLLDDVRTLKAEYRQIDKCPLGSAAGYGTNLGIDRKYVADILGFSRVPNVISIANSRGKDDAAVISSLHQIMLTLSRMSSDLILWSTSEFGFVKLPVALSTGSSIMPQKRNPDILELIRAKAAVLEGNYITCSSIVQDLPSGYHRDLQLVKKCVVDSIETTERCLSMMHRIMTEIDVDKKRCYDACSPELWATDEAYRLVKKGVAFREAYHQVASQLEKVKKPQDPVPPQLHTSDLQSLLFEQEKILVLEKKKLREKFSAILK